MDKIYPQNRNLQDQVRNFLERLSDNTNHLIRLRLASLSPEQQGNVLLRLSESVEPNQEDIDLDLWTIDKAIQTDTRNQNAGIEVGGPPPELPVDVDLIYPQNRPLLEKIKDFLSRLSRRTKDLIRARLGSLPLDQQGNILNRLSQSVDPYRENIDLDLWTIDRAVAMEDAAGREGVSPTEPPPVNVEKIYPQNNYRQDKAKNYLGRLTKESKDLLRDGLPYLPLEQQGRILSHLADSADPNAYYITLDPDTIRREIEWDQRNQIPVTETITQPPIEEPPLDMNRIFPQDPYLQNALKNFVNRLSRDSKNLIRYLLGNLSPDQQGRALARLSDGVDPYRQNIDLDPESIKKAIEMDNKQGGSGQVAVPPTTEPPPVYVEEIYPQNKYLQDKVRNYLDRLTKESKDLLRRGLPYLPQDQQGRILSHLADSIHPNTYNIALDPDTIRREVEWDQRSQRPITETITQPSIEEPPLDMNRIFPQDPYLQSKLKDFVNRLSRYSKNLIRYLLGNLSPDQQGRALAHLSDETDPYGQNIALDSDSIKKAIEMDNKQEGSGGNVNVPPVGTSVAPFFPSVGISKPPHIDRPLDMDRIYPHNKALQNIVKDFVDRLSNYSKNLIRIYLGNLAPKQQGRILLRLSEPIDPSEQDIVLDSDTIRKEIRMDKGGKKAPETTEEPPVDVEKIYPQSKELQNKTKNFLDRLTKGSSNLIRQHVGNLTAAQQGRVLSLLSDPIDPSKENITLDANTILKAIDIDNNNFKEEYKGEKPPVDVEKIYPDNLDQQDKVRDFLDQLSKDSQDLVGLYLGNRTSEQQGRVLLDLSKNVDPTQNNVTLDADTIKEAIERDERRNIEGTMEVTKFIPGTIAPPTTVSTSTIAGTESPSPHRLENIFPTKPELQKRLEKFWYNLTPASQTTLRNSICNLKPEKQRRILVYLARVSEAKTDQTGDKMKLDSDTMEKVVSMDDEGQMGESQKIIDDGKWPDHPLNEDSSAIDFKTEAPSSGGGIVQQAACLSLVTVVLLAV